MKKFALILLFATIFAGNAFAVDFKVHGYYRTRGEVMQNLDTQKNRSDIAHNNHRFGLIAFNQMRLRVEPNLKLNDNISLFAQVDILDNIAFGTKTTQQIYLTDPMVGTVTMPPGAGSISLVGSEAGVNQAINIRRVYADILFPIGKLRIGRQPSNWGLGIFQNDGNEVQGDFGDTADRVFFATQYEFDDTSSLTAGVLWDIAFESQFDPRIEGLGGAVSSAGKDAQQYALVMVYDRPELSVGIFGGARRRGGGSGTTMTALNPYGNSVAAGVDGSTLVYFGDIYARYSYEEYTFKAEYVYLGGKMSTGLAIDAIPFSAYDGLDSQTTSGIIQLPAKQDVQVNMAAFEASGLYNWGGEWSLKSGFAQGDASPLSSRITQYGFRPDYQIALLMFHVPLGTSPSLWGPHACEVPGSPECATSKLGGGLPITGNYINNAIYVATGYKHHFDVSDSIKGAEDLAVGASVITAWANKDPLNLNFASILGQAGLPTLKNSSKWYGIEIDAIAELKLYKYLYAALEGGILIPGAAYDIKAESATDLGTVGIETIPFSKAQIAYGGRLSLIVNY